jgi:hypothetical protein
MDLAGIGRVLTRFKGVVIAGLVLAIALAFLSYFRISFAGGFKLTPRGDETWSASALLLVTEHKFIWGSTTGASGIPGEKIEQGESEGRLVTLATLYAKFALGDEVRRLMLKDGGPIHGILDAGPLPVVRSSDNFLPIVNIVATTSTSESASRLAERNALALRRYIEDRQAANKIPQENRVRLELLRGSATPELVSPRSKTLPMIAFFLVMVATIGLTLVLENLRPRIRAVAESPAALPDATRRVAR